nr:Sua5/YciO/YrdC/YwlC family protein [Actinomycetota bacterium]
MIDVRAAIAALGRGEVVVLPTDTVYGLAASPSRPEAVRALFTLKGRRATKAIPVLGDGIDALSSVAAFDERAERVARRHWPGPLTLVLRRRA